MQPNSPKPTTTTTPPDANGAEVAAPSTTEVEVSLDTVDKLYSIVVTEDESLQSIVAVPTADENEARDDPLTLRRSGSRLADSLRPTSPIPGTRHSALEDRNRNRPCPPLSRRFPSQSTPSKRRDASCPPIKGSSKSTLLPPLATPRVRKPNLVSKAASRAGKLFPRGMKSRKIIPAL